MQVVSSRTESDRDHSVRIGGGLSLSVAALGAVQLVSGPDAGGALWLLTGLVTAFAIVGLGSLLYPRGVPDALVTLAVVGGTLAIPAGMVAAGLRAVDSANNEMLFLVPVVYGAYFFTPPWSAIVVLIASASYGGALLRLTAAQPGQRWLTTTVALIAVAAVVAIAKTRQEQRLDQVLDDATSESLTGLANRRALEADAPQLIATADRVSLLLFDLDHFKVINDTYGHPVGDDALILVASVLSESAERGQGLLAARLGGDEFVLLLPGYGPQAATELADSIRRRVRGMSERLPAPLTVSVGAATAEHPVVLNELLRTADIALYRAKRSGRDAVRFGLVERPEEETFRSRRTSIA
ncbi:MAG: hypothetical protein NVSMB4_11050 [Acidimicrobiales bacterium]